MLFDDDDYHSSDGIIEFTLFLGVFLLAKKFVVKVVIPLVRYLNAKATELIVKAFEQSSTKKRV